MKSVTRDWISRGAALCLAGGLLAGCASNETHRTASAEAMHADLPGGFASTPVGQGGAAGASSEHAKQMDETRQQVAATLQAQGFLTLPDALRLALANDESLSIANEEYAQVLIQRDSAKAATRPDIYARSSVSYEDESGGGGGDGGFSSSRGSGELSLSATMPIYSGFQDRSLRASLDALAASRLESMRQSRNELALNVAEAYFSVLRANRQTATLDTLVKLQTVRLDQIRKRVELGDGRRSEQLTIAADLASAVAERTRTEAQERLARQTLAHLIGVPVEMPLAAPAPLPSPTGTQVDWAALGVDLSLDSSATKAPQPPGTPENAALSDLLQNIGQEAPDAAVLVARARNQRPDLHALERLITMREHEREKIRREAYPDVDLNADLYPYRDGMGSQDDVQWQVELTADVPLWRSGRRTTKLLEADSLIRQAELAQERQSRQIELDVRSALTELASSSALLTALRDRVEAAQLASNQTYLEYTSGAATSLEFSDAFTNLREAALEYEAEILRNQYLYLRLKAVTGEFILGADTP